MRSTRLDNLKGILIILVVIGHFLLPISEGGSFVKGLFYAIYLFHMPAFVMISGYFAKTLYKDGKFRWKKLLRVLILYVIYEGIIFLTEKLAYPGYSTEGLFILHESGAPWYLMALFIWYLTIPIAVKMKEYPLSLLAVSISFALAIVLKYLINPGDFLALDRVIAFAPFFYVGYYCPKSELEYFSKSKIRFPTIAIAAFALLAVGFGQKVVARYELIVYGLDYNRFPAEMQPTLWIISICWYAIAFTVSLGLYAAVSDKKIPILTTIGRNSLLIYILHRPIRDLLLYAGLYNVVDPGNIFNIILIVVLSILLALILGNAYFEKIIAYIQSRMHKNA